MKGKQVVKLTAMPVGLILNSVELTLKSVSGCHNEITEWRFENYVQGARRSNIVVSVQLLLHHEAIKR